ncbi:UNVERIFIED_CONTAM: hypothetical protein Cloal_3140 [Acetivibrio alkalicellulosi]
MNNFKVDRQNEKIVIEYQSTIKVRIIFLVVVASFTYIALKTLNDLISINSIILFILVAAAFYLITKRDESKYIFDKADKTMRIQKTNFLNSVYDIYSFNEIVKFKIDKSISDDEYSNEEVEYTLFIEINQKEISIARSIFEREISNLADDIIMIIGKPGLAINKPDVLFKGSTENNNKEETPIDYYCEEIKSFNDLFGKLPKISGALFDKKIKLQREEKNIVLKVKKSILAKVMFVLVLLFIIFLANYVFILETIKMEKIENDRIVGEVIYNFLGKEKYETKRVVLENVQDVRIESDSESSYFVIIYNNNLRFKTSKFGQSSLNSVKSFMSDESSDSLNIKEKFQPHNILWILILSFVLLEFVLDLYITKITIDTANQIVIFELGSNFKKGKYPLHILKNIDYVPKGKKYQISLSLQNKKEVLGTMSNEDINVLKEFLESKSMNSR